MKPTEHAAWIREHINDGVPLRDIATRYAVPYWRVRNAVVWSDEAAAYWLEKYAYRVDAVRAVLQENPATHPRRNTLGIDPQIFRALRYALITTENIPNLTRYRRRITQQEETRIRQLATSERNFRKLSQLSKSTGRGTGQQAYIASRIIGERVQQYRRLIGTSIRGIADTYGLQFGFVHKMIHRGVIETPFDDDQFYDFVKRGAAMYQSLNDVSPPYRDIVAHYRTLYRSMYISKPYISEVSAVAFNTINTTLRRNGIYRELALHDTARYYAYNRAAVAQYYTKRYGSRIGVQMREYDNDWLHLKCTWYTWR